MQSKFMSFVEACTNTIVGLSIATFSNQLILPLFGYEVTFYDSFYIAVIFTLISVARNYLTRRFFNNV